MRKRIIAAVTSLVMAVTMIPAAVSAAVSGEAPTAAKTAQMQAAEVSAEVQASVPDTVTGYISKVYKNLADEPLNAGITNIGQASEHLTLEGRVPYVRRLTAYSGEEEHAKPLSEGHYIAVDLLADVNNNDGTMTR